MSSSTVTPTEPPSVDGESPAVPTPQPPNSGGGRVVRIWVAIAVVAAVIGGIAISLAGRGSTTTAEIKTSPTQATVVPTRTAPAAPVPAGTTSVPNVVGLSRVTAEAALTGAGFMPLATAVITTSADADSVVVQAPVAGVGLVSGSQVGIGIARANPPDTSKSLPSPNVYQMSKEQAQSVLMNAGLMPVFIYLPSDEAKGLVLTQAPLASEPVQMGGAVLVTMSTGVAPGTGSIPIPDVVGTAQESATKVLADAGLSFQIVLGPNAVTPKGSVFWQLPQAGGLVGAKTPVALAVSLGPIPGGTHSAVPDTKGMDAVTAVQTLADAGLLAQQADINDTQTSAGKVAGQVPPAGWTVPTASVVIISVATTPR